MAIEIGAAIRSIAQRNVAYLDNGEPATLYVRDVVFEIVGIPPAAGAQAFMISVMDATQWNTLQVGQTCTITITPPP